MKLVTQVNHQRFDVYDRRHDTEGTVVIETASGTVIRINEDCYKGIDICVEWNGKREVMSWSDEFAQPVRHYTFDVEVTA
jgi:hypothetical protein